MQQFFEKEGNARLLIRAGVAYMEYAKLLRTDTGTKALMGMLCYLYDMDAEPTKAQYKQALAHVIKTYEQENAAQMTQQNRMDTPKGLEDYINDVVGMGVGHMAAAGWLKESASLALSVMDETANSAIGYSMRGDWLLLDGVIGKKDNGAVYVYAADGANPTPLTRTVGTITLYLLQNNEIKVSQKLLASETNDTLKFYAAMGEVNAVTDGTAIENAKEIYNSHISHIIG